MCRFEKMRDTSAEQPVSDELIASLQPLTAAAVEREGDALPKIGVLSQREAAGSRQAKWRAQLKLAELRFGDAVVCTRSSVAASCPPSSPTALKAARASRCTGST